ncbi:MAG: hypothetical protein RL236_486 [Pseudomonadota bacterium]|jgi:hypothetical protein
MNDLIKLDSIENLEINSINCMDSLSVYRAWRIY